MRPQTPALLCALCLASLAAAVQRQQQQQQQRTQERDVAGGVAQDVQLGSAGAAAAHVALGGLASSLGASLEDRVAAADASEAAEAVENCGARPKTSRTEHDHVSEAEEESCEPNCPDEFTAPQDEARRRFVRLPPGEPVREGRAPKLALLMVADDRVANPDAWLAWIQDARRNNVPFRLLIHAANRDHFRDEGMAEFVVNKTVKTDWCNLWDAQHLLLRLALADPDVTHLAMVSHDTLPVKPLNFISTELAAQPATRMCADRDWSPMRAETWWLLRRADAELFSEHRKLAEATCRTGRCIDENSWYMCLAQRRAYWGRASAPLVEQCLMFTDWGGSCKHWARHGEVCNCPSLRGSLHFAANLGHPREYIDVDVVALRELLLSPFWFARKVGTGALTEGSLALLQEHWGASVVDKAAASLRRVEDKVLSWR